jgi:hypothetical protein
VTRQVFRGLAACTALGLLGGSGCSLFFKTDLVQCSSDGDCAARGAEFAGLRCSDSVCVPPSGPPPVETDASTGDAGSDGSNDPFACGSEGPIVPDPNRKVDVGIRYLNFTDGLPPNGLVVRLCSQTDPQCNNPRDSLEGNGLAPSSPDAGTGYVKAKVDGTVTAKVEVGFEGFFEVRSPDIIPAYRYTSPALRGSVLFDSLVFRPAEVEYLIDVATGKPNSTELKNHGIVFLFGKDCNRKPLAGVSFSTTAQDPIMQLLYIINTTPSTTERQTDNSGRGGYLNVPAGLHTFTAFFAETKQKIGSVRVFVKAGGATSVDVLPSP